MSIKKILNYSPNFDPKKRKIDQIKYLIFHYTGMKKEKEAVRRLTNIRSKVSSHYLIKKNGDIVVLVPDLYIAWHAGKSSWKKLKSLNKFSIGIELTNFGHSFGYKKFPKKQIFSLIKILKFLIKKYKIPKDNILGHSDIAPLRKKDPGEKFPWKQLHKRKVGVWYLKQKFNSANLTSKKIKNLFFYNLFRIGYRYLNKNKSSKNNILLIKAFQTARTSMNRYFVPCGGR